MARVTVEDCAKEVEDRFELVVLAAERAKKINAGAPITLDRENDKDPVVALREIAAGNIDIESLRESVISRLRKSGFIDAIDEDTEVDASSLDEDFGYVSNGSEFLTDEQGDFEEGAFDDIIEDIDEDTK